MPNKIDFSKMERLTPRADSWDKVCARLDAAAPTRKGNIIRIRSWFSAIPLVASLVLVSLTAILPNITESTETVSIQDVAPAEITSWYSSLGNSSSDDFDALEETVGFSYLTKE